jgi:hypothetical protein
MKKKLLTLLLICSSLYCPAFETGAFEYPGMFQAVRAFSVPNVTEIKIIARNIPKLPEFAYLSWYSLREAKKHYERTAYYDAYKHVLWSYLLTKAFGAEFARNITDAHETSEDSVSDYFIDRTNCAAGREFAESGYKENDLLALVREGREVVIAPYPA